MMPNETKQALHCPGLCTMTNKERRRMWTVKKQLDLSCLNRLCYRWIEKCGWQECWRTIKQVKRQAGGFLTSDSSDAGESSPGRSISFRGGAAQTHKLSREKSWGHFPEHPFFDKIQNKLHEVSWRSRRRRHLHLKMEHLAKNFERRWNINHKAIVAYLHQTGGPVGYHHFPRRRRQRNSVSNF